MKQKLVLVALVAITVSAGCESKQPIVQSGERQKTTVVKDTLGPLQKQITDKISTHIGQLQGQNKLIVAESTLDVIIERSEEDVLFKEVDWIPTISRGQSTVKLKLSGNKVQYKVLPADLKFDVEVGEVLKKVTIRSKLPVLDEELVEVQSNPDKMQFEKDMGWSHLESGRGEEMLTHIKQTAREEIIKSGQTPPQMAFAEAKGKNSLRETFAPLLKAIDESIILEVEYFQ